MTEDIWLIEEKLQKMGLMNVAGVDEAGRGPLAGPVVAAAVILPPAVKCRGYLPTLRESKQLTEVRREELYKAIRTVAVSIGIGLADVEYIDRYNILQATRAAMKQAVNKLKIVPDHVLVDAVALEGIACSFDAIVHGDEQCASIAAASIVAKVVRDRLMVKWDRTYPGYGFCRHKGYGTPEHLAALAQLGPCALHRLSFRPVRLAQEGAGK